MNLTWPERTSRGEIILDLDPITGRLREAALTYETLARLAPGRADVWKTLVALYLELGLGAEAERCARAALRVENEPAERARLEELLAGLAAAP